MNKIKLAVVDDQKLFRKGLISLIEEFDEFEVIIEASSGRELLELVECKAPDVILLDILMPEMDEIRIIERLRRSNPEIKILVLSEVNEEKTILQLIESGARGFLLKDNDIATVVDAIHSVIRNGYCFNEIVSKVMINELVNSKKSIPDCEEIKLSERELEIIRLICQEQINKEIADQLSISKRTVDGYREKILRKIKARNVAGIVMYAVKNGLVNNR